MKVLFCGNPDFALPTLNALLLSSHSVVGAVTSADKPRGRGRKLTPVPVKARALEAGLEVLQPNSLKSPEFLDRVSGLKPDCLTVVAFRILPVELFAMPRHGSFNVHPSLLPKGRGPAPIQWTLLRGERTTGVTIIQLSKEIDGGGILQQEKIKISDDDDFGSLHDKLSELGARLLVETLDALDQGKTITPRKQDENAVTKAPKLTPDDFLIDWDRTTDEILNKIRAFSPLPGAVTNASGKTFKILKAEVWSPSENIDPGCIFRKGNNLTVGTGTGAIRLNQVKPEGKRSMTVEEYLRGRPEIPLIFDKTKH